MLQVWYSRFGGVLLGMPSGIGREVGTFGEDEQPHGIELSSASAASHRTGVPGIELLQPISHDLLICCPLAGHEYETVELHGWAD